MKSVLYLFKAKFNTEEMKRFIYGAVQAFDIVYDKDTKLLSCDFDNGGLLKESLLEYKYIAYRAQYFKKEQVYLLMTYKPIIISYE